MCCIFLRYVWPADIRVRLVYADVPLVNFREHRDNAWSYLLESSVRKAPAAALVGVNTIAVRIDLDWLRNGRFNRHNGTIRIVGISFQGSGRPLSTFQHFCDIWADEKKEILIERDISQVKLFLPNHETNMEGLLFPVNYANFNSHMNQTPPEVDSNNTAEVMGSTAKRSRIEGGNVDKAINDIANEAAPLVTDKDDLISKTNI